MFGGLFGKKKAEAPRTVSRVKELNIGDVVTIGFNPVSASAGCDAVVEHLRCLDISQSESRKMLFSMGSGKAPFMLSDRSDSEIEVWTELQPEMVDELFGLDQFGDIFMEDAGDNMLLTRRNQEPDWATGMTTTSYFQTAGNMKAYVTTDDARSESDPHWSEVTRFAFTDDSQKFGLEAHVYEQGDTSVYLWRRLPAHTLEGFFLKQ